MSQKVQELLSQAMQLSAEERVELSDRTIRRVRVRKFPYIVVFEVTDEVRVVAVAHTSRRADY